MSQSPSYQRDTASASPESPKEGDFSPPLLCDNPKSLEEQETCDDQRDPIVNIIPDNCSSSPLNTQISAPLATNDLGKLRAGKLPQEQLIKKSQWREPRCLNTSALKNKLLVSPEFMEVRALDGRFITLVSTQTQTDWEWVEQSLSLSSHVQKEIEDRRLLQTQGVNMDHDSLQETVDEAIPQREYDIPCVGLPRLIAYKPEPKQTPRVEKVPEIEPKQDVHLAQCDYCQQLCQPFIHSKRLENDADFERLFCCEEAKQMRELILEVREKLAQKESDRKIDVNPHRAIMSEEERTTLKGRARERLKHLKLQRQSENISDTDVRSVEIKYESSCELSKEIPHISDEPHISQIDIENTTGMFTLLQEKTDGEPKPKEVIRKFYKSGNCFLTLFPDGTGNVFYPSGKAAIIISSTEAAEFTYVILEDKDVAPSIKGIFTNKGHSTCYHPSGMTWINLTPVGGLCFSEAGALRRRWNWLYFDPHACILPFKPLTFTLGPHISVRIHSQERVYVTFAHQRHSVRLSVGSKLIYPGNHDKPQQDVLRRYIQMKSSEIYSLLGQMQTCMSHRYRIIARTRRLGGQVKRDKSPENRPIHSLLQTLKDLSFVEKEDGVKLTIQAFQYEEGIWQQIIKFVSGSKRSPGTNEFLFLR